MRDPKFQRGVDMQIFQMLMDGASNQDICDATGLSPSTVSIKINSTWMKDQFNQVRDLVVKGMSDGMISPFKALQASAPDAVATLISTMQTAADPKLRASVANDILDRIGLRAPTKHVSISVTDEDVENMTPEELEEFVLNGTKPPRLVSSSDPDPSIH